MKSIPTLAFSTLFSVFGCSAVSSGVSSEVTEARAEPIRTRAEADRLGDAEAVKDADRSSGG
jgi:hypothetical protein